MKITPTDLENFFKAKKSTEKCAFCPDSTWTLLSEVPENDDETQEVDQDEDLAPLLIRISASEIDKTPTKQALIMLPMYCSNCGFVRQTHWGTFVEWKRSQAKKSADEE